MLPWHQAEGQRNRRLTTALGLSLAFHLVLALLPFSPFSVSPGGGMQGALAGSSSRASRFLSGALQGAEVDVQLPPPPASALAPPPPEPEPLPEEVREPEAESTSSENRAVGPENPLPGAASGMEAGSSLPAGEPGGSGFGAGDGPPAPPPEVAIRPRIYVHPRVPDEIVRKRKIDDFVLLQVLVGPTGQVRDVRLLRSIPNCPECTESAIDSARRSVYEPYVFQGRAVEVWSLPFPLHFSYRR